MPPPRLSRRHFLLASAATAATPAVVRAQPAGPFAGKAAPLPLKDVRLLASPYRDALEANRAYLLRLEPDRLLHNFRKHAGLPPKAAIYGGWEDDTIAGHTLGHYLTALSLMHAHTGDPACAERVQYIVAELAEAQRAASDGYVAGFTRRRGETIEDGRAIFPEIMSGDIRSAGFDLNGCWVPFYNWHKLMAGLFDAQTHIGNPQALDVAVRLAGFMGKVFASLDEAQLQQVLDCEHGGINESFAELHARTRDPRWLRLAERIRHGKVLDPLTAGRDALPWIHANTQIPKVIGLARLHELTGNPGHARAARFFWDTVTRNYSYVIGGNADREYFPEPRTISRHITEQTCESCNTYNMLKLTRHLYAWRPEARLFDYYERAHLNHILAHQDPATGMFAYMVPLMSGSHRTWSNPFDDFWCCVGSGMESHAKHGESIWWESGNTLIANLYIASETRWAARDATLRMETAYPFGERVDLTLATLGRPGSFGVALRVPGWCEGARVAVNGKPVMIEQDGGYAVVVRDWRAGDRIALTLPMAIRIEPTPDDPRTVALLHGPLVLAGDLGPADTPFGDPAPSLVAANPLPGITAIDRTRAIFRTTGVTLPREVTLRPFFMQRDRRTAVYFRRFTPDEWVAEQAAFVAQQAQQRALEARSVDLIHLGEMQPERDHKLEALRSHTTTYRGRHGRDAREEGWFEFRMSVRPGPLVLRATYWGEERRRAFDILVEGKVIASEQLDGKHPGTFFDADYPIPETLTRSRKAVTVRFQPKPGLNRAGPVFACRILSAETA